jgi:DNA ligase 1
MEKTMKLPTLYKKTSTGAIQQWNIHVIDQRGSATAACIITEYGQVGGKIQMTSDLIQDGKNVGKKNETTPRQQAEAEAQSQWEKKKKKGYVESVSGAEAGELDKLITGGVEPMLAQSFSKHGHKIKYPCFTQPKLDGIRCVAIIKDGECTLWSRTRKPILSCPHIVQELEACFGLRDIVLDGELYNHEYKTNFEKIVSLVRQEEPAPDHALVQYHVYDVVEDKRCGPTFSDRTENLDIIFAAYSFVALQQVETEEVESEDQVMDFFEKFRGQGYEGAMLRNADSEYLNKRSYDLQKVKEFDDAEFNIVGIEEGRGRLAGHVGAFICVNGLDKEFKAKAKGSTERLREYFENHELWRGKKLTVQYQGLTGKEQVPRFPVGVAIRDYE